MLRNCCVLQYNIVSNEQNNIKKQIVYLIHNAMVEGVDISTSSKMNNNKQTNLIDNVTFNITFPINF